MAFHAKEIRMTAVVIVPPLLCRYVFLFMLILLFSVQSVYAQDKAIAKNVSNMEKEALALYENQDFITALPLFSQLLALDPKNPDLNYRFGVCLLMGDRRDLERPLRFLEIAVKDPGIDKEAFFYLGMAYHFNYRFSDAINYFNRFVAMEGPDQVNELSVQRQIEMCENGYMLLSDVSDIYVLSRSQVNLSDFYRAYQLKNFGGEFLLKPDNFKSKTDKKYKDNDVMFFPRNIDEVFFASYGDDTKNGRDIYHAFREPDGSWGKPIRLAGGVNSPYDEAYPYLMPDGKTLYFCSKGHNSMGGYDVFISRLDSLTGRWGKPENLDFAINTPFDDFLFVTEKSKRIAYFASNRSSSGNQVYVYKVRIDKRPEKSRDVALQPLGEGDDGNKARYEQSLVIIKEMSRLDVNADNASLADTSQPAPEIPVVIAKPKAETTSSAQPENLEQKMAKAVTEAKAMQDKVDSAYNQVELMSESMKAFGSIKDDAAALAAGLTDSHQKSVAKIILKELDKTAAGKHQRLENARYRAGLMQQLVATRKTDSALKVYDYFAKDIREIDTLMDYSDKLDEDLGLALSGEKMNDRNEPLIFTAEEIKKIRKDSVFLVSFVEQSASGVTVKPLAVTQEQEERPAKNAEVGQVLKNDAENLIQKDQSQKTEQQPTALSSGVVVTKTQQESKQEVPTANQTDVPAIEGKIPTPIEKQNEPQKVVAAAPVKGKDAAAERMLERNDSLEEYQLDIQKEVTLVESYVAMNIEMAKKKENEFNELARKKQGRPQDMAAREARLQDIRKEAITFIAKAKVALAYEEILNASSASAIRGTRQLDSLSEELSQAMSPEDVTSIMHLMEVLVPRPDDLSPEHIATSTKQKISSEIIGVSTAQSQSQLLAYESILLDSLARELSALSKDASSPGQKEVLENSASEMQRKSAETGRRALALNDQARAQLLFNQELLAIADIFSLNYYSSDTETASGKNNKTDGQATIKQGEVVEGQELNALQLSVMKMSPALATTPEASASPRDNMSIVERQKEILPSDQAKALIIHEEVKQKISNDYSTEIALIMEENRDVPIPADTVHREIKEAPVQQQNQPTQSSEAQKVMESSTDLSRNVASGIEQIDRAMDNELPDAGIPLLQTKLEEYMTLADKGLEEIIEARIEVQTEQGSYSDVARFLELKEFEIRASRNRAKYLSNKLTSIRLTKQSGEMAMLGSASLLESDSDILFAKALILRDSIEKAEGFILKKQMYVESFALEDTALSRQGKAIIIREKAAREQALVQQNALKEKPLTTAGKEVDTEVKKVADVPVKPPKQEPAVPALSDRQRKESSTALNEKLEEGVSQIDQMMKNEIPAGSIPQVMGQLAEYIKIADKGLAEIRDSKNTVIQEKGRDSEIAMFLELKEFEVRASRNRALYLSGKLKSKELTGSNPAAPVPVSVSQLEKESEARFKEANTLRDSMDQLDAFLEKKQLYTSVFSLEDSAISLQDKANLVRESEIRKHSLASSGKAAKDIASGPLPVETQKIISSLPQDSRPVAEKVARAVREQKLPEMQGLYYTVQVGVFATPRSSDRLMGVSPLFEDRLRNGYYRYFSGIYSSKAAATEAKNAIVLRGIKDAFVVAIYNGEKLSVTQAKAYEPKSIENQISSPAVEAVVKSMTQSPGEPVFRVQLGAFRIAPTQALLTDFAVKSGEKIITDLSATGLSLVMTNSTSSFEQAQAVKQKAVAAGIKDAFIVGYIGSERTTAARVKSMLNIK